MKAERRHFVKSESKIKPLYPLGLLSWVFYFSRYEYLVCLVKNSHWTESIYQGIINGFKIIMQMKDQDWIHNDALNLAYGLRYKFLFQIGCIYKRVYDIVTCRCSDVTFILHVIMPRTNIFGLFLLFFFFGPESPLSIFVICIHVEIRLLYKRQMMSSKLHIVKIIKDNFYGS